MRAEQVDHSLVGGMTIGNSVLNIRAKHQHFVRAQAGGTRLTWCFDESRASDSVLAICGRRQRRILQLKTALAIGILPTKAGRTQFVERVKLQSSLPALNESQFLDNVWRAEWRLARKRIQQQCGKRRVHGQSQRSGPPNPSIPILCHREECQRLLVGVQSTVGQIDRALSLCHRVPAKLELLRRACL